jgi:uncharacterized membrane protein
MITLPFPKCTAAIAAALLLVGATTTWSATTETFVPTVIQYPGSTSTIARGINNSGDIVGTYTCAVACINPVTGETSTPGTHGFLLQDGVYTRIDVPGGTATVARGIGEQRMIVGHYNVGAVTHGFAYFEGFYMYPIDVPAEAFNNPGSPLRDTLPVRISPEGDIVGCFHEDGQTMTTMHGWLLHNGNFTVLVTPHSAGDRTSRDPDTMNNGIASTGEIVGFYLSSGVSYIARNNVIVRTFTFDGNLFTLANDVNARGDIVGVHGDNQANTGVVPVNPHGFVRTKHGEYTSLDVQGAISTTVNGINARREIVGTYTDVTGTHGFLYRLRGTRDERDGDDERDRDR